MYLPFIIRRSKRCERCGLLHPHKEDSCMHCHNLNDQEVNELKKTHAENYEAHANLGKLFFFIAAILFLALILTII